MLPKLISGEDSEFTCCFLPLSSCTPLTKRLPNALPADCMSAHKADSLRPFHRFHSPASIRRSKLKLIKINLKNYWKIKEEEEVRTWNVDLVLGFSYSHLITNWGTWWCFDSSERFYWRYGCFWFGFWQAKRQQLEPLQMLSNLKNSLDLPATSSRPFAGKATKS